MKKVIYLSLAALSLTLFSFKTHNENVFELQENGNYKIINGSKISQEDVEFLISQTKEFYGAGVFRTIKIFKTKASKDAVSESVTKDTQNDCDCPDDPKPKDTTIEQLIEKYN